MRELSGAIDVCKSMKGTYSQWISVLLWSRRLGLSFFFPLKRSNLLLSVVRRLPFPFVPCSALSIRSSVPTFRPT